MQKRCLHNESELLRQLNDGDHQAFTFLYREYSEALYYNILSMVKDENTAEELVQEIFAHIWNKRESIHVQTTFANYMFTVSRNRVYDFFQQLDRDQDLYSRIRSTASENYSHVEEDLFARENRDLLDKAIASLPPQRRKAFELCKLEGLSYQKASEQMGVSLSTLKDHMANARYDLQQYISTHRETAISLVLFFLFMNP